MFKPIEICEIREVTCDYILLRSMSIWLTNVSERSHGVTGYFSEKDKQPYCVDAITF